MTRPLRNPVVQTDGLADVVLVELDAAGEALAARQEALGLQGSEMALDGAGRGEPEPIGDLADGRRRPVALQGVHDVRQHLRLSIGQ